MPSKIKALSCAAALALSACANQTRMRTAQTAPEIYHSLSGPSKSAFASGYEYGKADETKTLYWATFRRGWLPPLAKQEQEAAKEEGLRRTYVNLPVPEHTAPDGTVIEAHYQPTEEVY
jgi:hypothetical protein